MTYRAGTVADLNPALAEHHYLGPVKSATFVLVQLDGAGVVVGGQAWRKPSSRHLPSDGSWLELVRWILTPACGDNAGSRMHRATVRELRQLPDRITTLVSYSDPSAGHTGALYRACNWQWAPTWQRMRPPPTGNGDWGTGRQSVKDRWIFPLSRDCRRGRLLRVNDSALNPRDADWAPGLKFVPLGGAS